MTNIELLELLSKYEILKAQSYNKRYPDSKPKSDYEGIRLGEFRGKIAVWTDGTFYTGDNLDAVCNTIRDDFAQRFIELLIEKGGWFQFADQEKK